MKSTEGQQTWTCNVKVSPFSLLFTSAVFRRHSPEAERLVAWKNRFPARGAWSSRRRRGLYLHVTLVYYTTSLIDQILVPTFIVDLLFCVEQRFPSWFSRSFNSFIHMLHCAPWHCSTPRGAAPQHAIIGSLSPWNCSLNRFCDTSSFSWAVLKCLRDKDKVLPSCCGDVSGLFHCFLTTRRSRVMQMWLLNFHRSK